MDSGSESRSMVDGGSPRSVTQGSTKSLPAFLEHTNVALYQVSAAASPYQAWNWLWPVWKKPIKDSLSFLGAPSFGVFLVAPAHEQQLQKRETGKDTWLLPAWSMS